MRQPSTGLTTASIILHAATCFSAIIVLGITAWAVKSTKTVTVIYSLTIAVLSIVCCLGAFFLGAIKPGRKWFAVILLVIDMIFAFLWIAAFILLANDFNRYHCNYYLWRGRTACSRKWAAEAFTFLAFFFTLVAACLEIYMLYSARDSDTGDGLPRHSEKRLSGYSAATSEGTNAAAAGAPAATNGTGSTTNPAPGTGVGTSYRADPEAGGTGTGYGTGTGTGQGYGTAAGTTEGNTTGGTTGAAHNVV